MQQAVKEVDDKKKKKRNMHISTFFLIVAAAFICFIITSPVSCGRKKEKHLSEITFIIKQDVNSGIVYPDKDDKLYMQIPKPSYTPLASKINEINYNPDLEYTIVQAFKIETQEIKYDNEPKESKYKEKSSDLKSKVQVYEVGNNGAHAALNAATTISLRNNKKTLDEPAVPKLAINQINEKFSVPTQLTNEENPYFEDEGNNLTHPGHEPNEDDALLPVSGKTYILYIFILLYALHINRNQHKIRN